MKKFLALLLALTMIFTLAACNNKSDSPVNTGGASPSGGNPDSGNEAVSEELPRYKIGVLEAQLNDESTNRVEYFNNYIGPKYNCEFMFSEAAATVEAAMTFVENAADAGCNAILSYYPMPADTEQLVQLCAEYGMAYVENGGRNPVNDTAFQGHYENFAGGFMADQPATGKLFRDYLISTMSAEEGQGFLVATGGAYQGNPQQTEISLGMITAIQEVYGLTFEGDVMDYITSSSPIMAANDKGIEIYCYPGTHNTDGWLEGLSAALQTGRYGYAMFAYNAIGNVGTVVSEVESALNKDVTVVGFGTFGDALTNALSTKDPFGNPFLSMSTVKFTSLVSAMGFSKLHNLLSGYEAAYTVDGEPAVALFTMQAVTSAEQLAIMTSWDKPGTWVADYDFVDSLLAVKNPDLTAAQVQQNIYGMTYDVIAARLG